MGSYLNHLITRKNQYVETVRSKQTVQRRVDPESTLIRLFPQLEQSEQGLLCLPIHQHFVDTLL